MKTILFDLDGTLLPMNQDAFLEIYYKEISKFLANKGFDAKSLLKAINDGTMKMITNNGFKTNEDVFYECFFKETGIKKEVIEPIFNEFYKACFNEAMKACGKSSVIKDCIKTLKKKEYQIILATNPLFPPIATKLRIGWAGLDDKDFSYITTYDNSKYCKPNVKYYEELINKHQIVPEDTYMIGNDTTEDMISRNLGFKTYLVIDDLIDKKNIKDEFTYGSREDLLVFIEEVL